MHRAHRRARGVAAGDGTTRRRPGRFGSRLYLRIYWAVLASLAVTALLFALAMRLTGNGDNFTQKLDVAAEAAAELLPPKDAPQAAQQAALERWHKRAGVDLALYGADGKAIAAAGAALPVPNVNASASHWQHGRTPGVMLKLPDGRWLAGKPGGIHGYGPLNIAGALALIAIAVGIVALPITKRMMRRLESLQQSVEALGEGDLGARVAVRGHDEVARLAESFNRAAARIEGLVEAQKSLLANASHELRSPLARIRMAAELQAGGADANTRKELERNIAELDQLIDEILLASRLDSAARPEEHFEAVDLTALLAEECARAEVQFDGDLATVQGDARLLRRLIRNLIENARRYGGDQPVEVTLAHSGGDTVLEVADRGPGVAAAERERIFEPFYRARGASEQQGGVGLGLALVRQIAARHQAQVECLERPGGGSIFRVGGLKTVA